MGHNLGVCKLQPPIFDLGVSWVYTLGVYRLQPPILDLVKYLSGTLQSGGLHSGGLPAPATDFGSCQALIWGSEFWSFIGGVHSGILQAPATDFGYCLGSYTLGVCTLGIYKLQ